MEHLGVTSVRHRFDARCPIETHMEGSPPGERTHGAGPFHTDIPARLDHMRWGRFHTLLVAALGTSWIIDGLEVTLVGALASTLTLPTALGLSSAQVGEAAGGTLPAR